MWPSSEWSCHNKSIYSSQSTQEGINRSTWRRWNEIISYEGLNSEYQHMLAHNVDDKHPASYSNLLLAAQKLERQAEARDPLLSKPTMTGGTNVTWPHLSGNLFPSRKLKGNHTFTAQSTIMESVGTEGDLTEGPEGRRDWISRGRHRNPQWDWWSRSAAQLYHLLCQHHWATTKEKVKLFHVQHVLTIWWKIVQWSLARLPEKWV